MTAPSTGAPGEGALSAYYADMHIHLGRAGRVPGPVKIAASERLTLEGVLEEAAGPKGLDLVGIVDAQTEGAFEELEGWLAAGRLEPLAGGGLRYRGRVTLIPGAEVNLVDPEGGHASHWLAYFPDLGSLRPLARWLAGRLSNPRLSTQRLACSPSEWLERVEGWGGVGMAAHAFTPYTGCYGAATGSLRRLLGEEGFARLGGLELGLSAETAMADALSELAAIPYLANSDAHSLPRLAREYSALLLAAPTYREWRLALEGREGRRILALYGLDPRLGKYHRTYCLACEANVAAPPPAARCDRCGGSRVVFGVADRLALLADREPRALPHRPPYVRQVPLQFIPGLGPRTLARLIDAFGSEMAVLHRATPQELEGVVGEPLARRILAARAGEAGFAPGGGGRYGRMLTTP